MTVLGCVLACATPAFASLLCFKSGGVGSRLEVEIHTRRKGKTEMRHEVTTIRGGDGRELLSGTSYDGGEEVLMTYRFLDPREEIQCGNEYDGMSWEDMGHETLRIGSRRIDCVVTRERSREPAYYADDSVAVRVNERTFWRRSRRDEASQALKSLSYGGEMTYRDGRHVAGRLTGKDWVSDLDAGVRVGKVRYRCRVVHANWFRADGRVEIARTVWIPEDLPIPYLRSITVELDSAGVATRTEERLKSLHLVPAPKP